MESKNQTKAICWLRRDLRLADHCSLFEATRNSSQVVLVFVFDPNILSHLKNKNDRRVTLIVESLKEIDLKLRSLDSKLVVLKGDPVIEIPKLAKLLDIQSVFTNEDYEPYAKKRDQKIKNILRKMNVSFFSFKDQVIFSGNEILKKDKTPYRVFTPYKNEWLKRFTQKNISKFDPDLKKLMPYLKLAKIGIRLNYEVIGFVKTQLTIPTGETGAHATLRKFQKSLDKYNELRNFPALNSGTSHLSPHLRFGTISVRELVRSLLNRHSAGRKMWLTELIWRDFYQMILDRFPYVEKRAFLPKYENIRWPGRSRHFLAWCEGKTGYPLIDAAMRQLNQTGWMHNRLRMVVASFLVKDLLIDWRRGEKYFSEKLLDFDLASNNGGWQWCASTGCDAQPYFRVFNPITQSKKFDSRGDFIHRWVPELKKITDDYIHFPADAGKNELPKSFHLGKDYPKPIVDHAIQRERALLLY